MTSGLSKFASVKGNMVTSPWAEEVTGLYVCGLQKNIQGMQIASLQSVSLNGHLYKRDTLLKWTPSFTPSNELTFHKMEISKMDT